MKKYLLIICLHSFYLNSFGQSISYNQIQQLFNTWKTSNGKNIKNISIQLKTISPKWKIESTQPVVENGNTYYDWKAIDAKGDTSVVALYFEEDETTIKYSLRYAFHSQSLYNSMQQSLRTSSYYKDKIVTQTDEAKGEKELYGKPDENLPLSKRIDFVLSDFNLKSSGNQKKVFMIDIFSRYIPK